MTNKKITALVAAFFVVVGLSWWYAYEVSESEHELNVVMSENDGAVDEQVVTTEPVTTVASSSSTDDEVFVATETETVVDSSADVHYLIPIDGYAKNNGTEYQEGVLKNAVNTRYSFGPSVSFDQAQERVLITSVEDDYYFREPAAEGIGYDIFLLDTSEKEYKHLATMPKQHLFLGHDGPLMGVEDTYVWRRYFGSDATSFSSYEVLGEGETFCSAATESCPVYIQAVGEIGMIYNVYAADGGKDKLQNTFLRKEVFYLNNNFSVPYTVYNITATENDSGDDDVAVMASGVSDQRIEITSIKALLEKEDLFEATEINSVELLPFNPVIADTSLARHRTRMDFRFTINDDTSQCYLAALEVETQSFTELREYALCE